MTQQQPPAAMQPMNTQPLPAPMPGGKKCLSPYKLLPLYLNIIEYRI